MVGQLGECLAVAGQELVLAPAGPRPSGRDGVGAEVGVGLAVGSGGIVERPHHPGEVPHRQVGGGTLGEGPQRLTLEVQDDPAAGRVGDDLAEVQVGVDPL